MERKIIESGICQCDQNVIAHWIIKMDQYKISAKIVSDAYDFQSSAVSQVWNPETLQWQKVYDIPYAEMATRKSLYVVRDNTDPKYFKEDFERLMRMTEEILSAATL